MILQFWTRSKLSLSLLYNNPVNSRYFTTSFSYVTYKYNDYSAYNCNIFAKKTGTGNTGYILLSKSKLLQVPAFEGLFPACRQRHNFSHFVKGDNKQIEMSHVGNLNNNNEIDGEDKKHKNNDIGNEEDFLKDCIEIECESTEELTDQVSGHSTNLILKYKCQDRTLVLKPVQKPPFGKSEVNFYRAVFANRGANDEIHQQLEKLIPKFHGLCRIKGSEKGVYMILDDILEGFTSSCAVDVKIGSKTWDPSASPQKISHERSKYPGTKGPLGLSITGMQYYRTTNHGSGDISEDSSSKAGKLIKYDKEFGKNLVESTIHNAFIEFFQNQRNLMEICLKKLIKIQDFFHHQKQYAFYSSSLLITYDANAIIVPGDGQDQGQNDLVRIYMIDFAHVFQNNGQPDDNYIHGLNNLVKIFKEILLK